MPRWWARKQPYIAHLQNASLRADSVRVYHRVSYTPNILLVGSEHGRIKPFSRIGKLPVVHAGALYLCPWRIGGSSYDQA